MSDTSRNSREIEESITKLKAQFENAQNDRIEKDKDVQELLKKEAELRKELSIIHNLVESNKGVLHDVKVTVNKTRRQIEEEERELHRVKVNEKARDELETDGMILDILTSNAYWRKENNPNGEGAFKHQIEGARQFAVIKRGLLADVRGLGKTLSSIIWCDMVEAKRVLIFVPKETVTNFRNEIPRWAPNRPVHEIVSENKAYRDRVLSVLANVPSYNVIMNLEAWRKDSDVLDLLRKMKPDAVVIDEAHKVKTHTTVTFKGVQDIVYTPNHCPSCGGSEFEKFGLDSWKCLKCEKTYLDDDDSIRSVKYVLPMTGTPILNRPDELFSVCHLVDRKGFPSIGDFRDDFLINYDPNRWGFREGGLESLVDKLGMRYLKRTRESAGIKIPPQTTEIIELDFNPEQYPRQWKAYQICKEHMAIILEEDEAIPIPAIIAQLTRLRQLITWPMGIEFRHPKTKELLYKCNIDESVKMDEAAAKLIEFTEEGLRSVAFSQFSAPLQEVNKRLLKRGVRSIIYDGSTPDPIREKIKYDFDIRNRPPGSKFDYDVALCNYKVGGESVNLNAATETLIIDREWNPGKEDQALGRTNRIGQTRETRAHILRAIPSVDTWLDRIIEEKSELVNKFETQVAARAAALDFLKGKD